ncbi:MAG: methylmalonyl-CoA mutase [Planctomycetota bacterium]|jgi:methylmalonyl-CoA mutase
MTSPNPSPGATWRARVEKELAGASFDDLLLSTLAGGISVDPLGPDVEEIADAAGFPGLGRQVRGGRCTGPLGGTLCAPLRDEPLPEDLNQALLEDLKNGAPAVHIALDRGARLGDAGPQAASSDRGLLLGTRSNLAHALRDVRRDAVELTFDAGANARPLLQLLIATEAGEQPGTYELGHDPLAALATDGALPGSLASAWDDAVDLIAQAETKWQLRPLSIDSRPFHEAGCDMLLELGLLLASGAQMLRELETRGVTPEIAAQHVTLRLALAPDVFPSLALLRAARLTWTQLLHSCGVSTPPPTRIHAFEGARSLSKRDPWINILRTTTLTFAAQTGGADIFTPLTYDRALGVPGQLGRRVARNTPNILALEGHVQRVIDPAGGSGHVEALTDSIARGAWAVLQSVEANGGISVGLLDGSIQARIAESHAARRQDILAGRPKLVGVSLYPPAEVAIPAGPHPLTHLARDVGDAADIDLATASQDLDRGASASCSPLPRQRDAAPFEEEGFGPLEPKAMPAAKAAKKQEVVR